MAQWEKSFTDYADWESGVNAILKRTLGAPIEMLPDYDWRAEFDADTPPRNACDNYFNVIDTL